MLSPRVIPKIPRGKSSRVWSSEFPKFLTWPGKEEDNGSALGLIQNQSLECAGPQNSQNSEPKQEKRILDQLWIPSRTRACILPTLSIPKIPSLARMGGYWISWISSGSYSAPEPGLCLSSSFPKFPPWPGKEDAQEQLWILSSTIFSPQTLGKHSGRSSQGSENVGLSPSPHSWQPSAAPAEIHPSLSALPAPRLRSAPGSGSPGLRRG